MNAKAFILIGFLAACSGPRVPGDCTKGKPGECRALRIVWNDFLAQNLPEPPVTWVAHAWPANLFCQAPPCTQIYGQYDGGTYTIQVVDFINLAHSSYAHEMLHAALDNQYGDGDGDHTRPAWGTIRYRAADRGLLDDMNDELTREGL